jgi:antitoxin (DNA-binding transcriptional repressor) of toxin-antitoxin stability system
MPPVTLEDACNRLPELLSELQPGEELVISENGSQLAKLTRC